MKMKKFFRNEKTKHIALIVALASGAVLAVGIIRGSVMGCPSDANTIIGMVSAAIWMASWFFLELNFCGAKENNDIKEN